ncbi:MAG: methyltransferase domain-containing protein [Phycisphaerae bacterium]
MREDTSTARPVATELDQSTKASDLALFFRKFVEKGRGISSFVPSSRTMACKLLELVDFERPGTIIELGAGTGPVTEQILARIRPHHRFVAVENDPDFVEILRRRFSEHLILQADATRLAEPLARMGVQRARYVISCLPTPALPRRGLVRMIRWLRRTLEPDGLFLQLTIVPLIYRRFYQRLFAQVGYNMVWRNMPPGGVYVCRRPHERLLKPALGAARKI